MINAQWSVSFASSTTLWVTATYMNFVLFTTFLASVAYNQVQSFQINHPASQLLHKLMQRTLHLQQYRNAYSASSQLTDLFRAPYSEIVCMHAMLNMHIRHNMHTITRQGSVVHVIR